VKVDKTLIASVALHVLVIGWGLVSFSARSLEAPPPESMPIDIISADQLSKITAGIKTGEKDKPKPMVEKVAEARPAEDAVGKITEKKEIVTASAPEPPPKPVEKPIEKKTRTAETGCREQTQGRAEAGREEARAAQDRSDRRSVEIGRDQKAGAEA
jgi:outer membrane biosynthesis protein TonB